jgi:hypothetical protein
MKNKVSRTALQIKILIEKTNDIYRYAKSFKLNLVNHISLMFGWKDQIFLCNCFWDIAILLKALEFNHKFAILLAP